MSIAPHRCTCDLIKDGVCAIHGGGFGGDICQHRVNLNFCPECKDVAFMKRHEHADMIEVDDKTGRPVAAHYYPKAAASKELQKIVRRANGGN